MKMIIMIPAYNEELNIVNTVNSVQEKCPGVDFVVINDGSSDTTGEICIKNSYPLLDLPVNLGLSGAFQTGIRYAYEKGYDAALQFDGDGQHEASCIPKLVQALERDNVDIVIGSRFVTDKKPFSMRMMGSRLLTSAIRLTTGKVIADPTSGMRLYGRNIMSRYANHINYGPEPDTLAYLIRAGAKVSEVQVEMHERVAGSSYLTIGKSIKYMVNMFISILLIQFFRKREE